jgi:preprotein translocase subunit SecA
LIPKIAQNQEVWKAQILKEVKDCLEEQRPLLLLCQDLRNSNIIAGFLDSKQYSYRKYDSSYQKISMENICPCDIIVATNIAGRGTDLKLSQEAVKNGGLHVLLAFMPNNMRIE